MLKVNRDNNTLDIIGEVDISTAEEFKDGILALVEEKVPEINLNMQDMEYIDSTGLGILMDIKKVWLVRVLKVRALKKRKR